MNISLPKWLLGSMAVTAFLGFLDAVYLTTSHYSGFIPPCYIVSGCEQVTTSSYSMILGVPVALMGALYYVFVLGTILFLIDKKKTFAVDILYILTTFGMLFTLWFLYVQAELIHAWCMYCLFSALTSTLLFVFANIAYQKKQMTEVQTLS